MLQVPTLTEGSDIQNSRGYPALCSFASSDDDFFAVRRFEKLGARVILMLQDRIAFLEEQLIKQDTLARKSELDCGTFRWEPIKERRAIMDEIFHTLKEYRETIY